ncbi:glucose-1-phosphate adenylyltransferase [Elizabethkingia meningoseptica]|uniref:Glucose-1-phosphate adenylyltransferase n=1 Tax=Elizabethkingia meningoseptica TaxID=238 RepID=A0A1V3U0N5_ELIME|nr:MULTISPECIES: glucose-1-phosphate adenylyltransferase [Elizabethkingia]AQX13651.1 glucose-1-phosphate adenylyltransferase [Elizabethkingia meningoseptica]MBG0515442.1 glucose-1-phosphate adenylyltransferase [Elizabethkingia meningoseptica]MDE5429746.1 glucose-1-phosphate adenylyltransferase [Elizabethkingia meningoseptica]MDE5434191.1 glucose-1-phosphate adenylyltransferase [Elizabethkingia meningoseptica]MDE5449219.1 glucose-1-phosphate adenylyltransferase [Elizabethkingia meningoseptica]
MDKKVISIVLGGGRGSRLYPLTDKRSKPAVPIAGKYRLVDIPISNCVNSGFNQIMVLTQFNSASLNQHIKNTYNFDVFSRGFVDIIAAEQSVDNDKWFQGTADAVRQSMPHLRKYDYDYLLILSGDQLYQMDFREMLKFHIENKGDITIATIPVNQKDATGFGILKSDDNNNITAFIEKPGKDILPDWKSDVDEVSEAQGKNYLASMGIYIFTKSILTKIFDENKGDDFGKEVIPAAIGNYSTLSYQYNGYWTDIGTIDSFFEANMDLTQDLPQFNMFSSSPIFTRSRMLPPTKINGSYMEKVVVGDGAIIMADRLEKCVIGNRARIGKGSVIKNTYMMGADFYQSENYVEGFVPLFGVGENCYIENTIIDKNCMIGNNVRIIGGKHMPDGDYDAYSVRDGIVVIKKEAIIPDGTIIQ